MTNKATEVVASLEGMKIIAGPDYCELHEYNFEENVWRELERCSRPISDEKANDWLDGWNRVDRFAALALLMAGQGE